MEYYFADFACILLFCYILFIDIRFYIMILYKNMKLKDCRN